MHLESCKKARYWKQKTQIHSDRAPTEPKNSEQLGLYSLRFFLRKLLYGVLPTDKGIKQEKQKHGLLGAFLVVQCLGIHLVRQGTLIQSLVQEDFTCPGATKPVCHNYWDCALEPEFYNERSHHDKKPGHGKSSLHSPQPEKVWVQQWRPTTAKEIK